MDKEFFIVDLDKWTYYYRGKGPTPPFPHRHAILYYLKQGSVKEFPKRLYKVLRRLFTNSLKLSQESSEKSGNTISGNPTDVTLTSNETL